MLLGPPIVGQFSWDAESAGQSSTNLVAWQNKLTLNVTGLPAGRYRVGWSAEISVDDENNPGAYQVQVDNVTTLASYAIAVKKKFSDAVGPFWYSLGGFGYIALTAGTHFVDFDYSSPQTKVVYVRNTRLELRRVS